MQDEFQKALKRALVHEGGKVDDPRDPGGRTNQGVTQKTYTAWRVKQKLPSCDVYLMTDGERDAIYKNQYWDSMQGDRMPPGVGYVVFDGCVNSGVSQSVKWLQRALNLKADGVVGNVTLAAMDGLPDHDALIARIIERRRVFLRELKTYRSFGKGWERRVANVLQAGQAWARGSVGPEVVYIPEARAKARIEDAKASPVRAPGDIATGVGAAAATINQATDLLNPLASGSSTIALIVSGLTVSGVALAIGGIVYRSWAASRDGQIKDALDIVPPEPVA